MNLFEQVGSRVSVYEVSPRDGLQNERSTVPLRAKLRLIDALVAAGLRRIEITSFVSPKWIPQLADADEVAKNATPPEGVAFSALCPNRKGLERARAAAMREIAVFVSASETHNKKNVNRSVADTLAAFEETISAAREAEIRVRGYVSTVWGCPFEGEVDPKRAVAIAKLRGPAEALGTVEPLAGPLGAYFHFHGVRGWLLMQLGRDQEARSAFDQAIALAHTPAEAGHIRLHLDRLVKDSSPA